MRIIQNYPGSCREGLRVVTELSWQLQGGTEDNTELSWQLQGGTEDNNHNPSSVSLVSGSSFEIRNPKEYEAEMSPPRPPYTGTQSCSWSYKISASLRMVFRYHLHYPLVIYLHQPAPPYNLTFLSNTYAFNFALNYHFFMLFLLYISLRVLNCNFKYSTFFIKQKSIKRIFFTLSTYLRHPVAQATVTVVK